MDTSHLSTPTAATKRRWAPHLGAAGRACHAATTSIWSPTDAPSRSIPLVTSSSIFSNGEELFDLLSLLVLFLYWTDYSFISAEISPFCCGFELSRV
jgi:hypothetical protein